MKLLMPVAALSLAVMLPAQDAFACGGFFCSRSPVDQTQEHILFVVGESTTTMVVQIAYAGGDADFSWVLPLGSVPDAQSLEVFPQLAMTSLAANTGPIFQLPQDCWQWYAQAGAVDADNGNPPPQSEGGGVTVHIREEVGPYDVAVVESQDPAALTTWLRDNGYRITEPMQPYIAQYTSEGMKFLALKLLPSADVSMIQPLKLTLPGTSPMVPIRLTAIAAEPEMGILVTILGQQRFEPANWPTVTINDDEIAFDPYNAWSPTGTNWAALVARKVDEAGGQGFVTEMAGPSAPIEEMVRNSPTSTPEQEAARTALLSVLEGNTYFSRMYTRLSPEEMRTDPIFRLSTGGDVDRTHQLSRYVNGVDMCPQDGQPTMPAACDFVACGAGGTCALDSAGNAGCACVDDATARAVTSPSGQGSVVCQDARMSFVNPGDRDDATGETLGDPCSGVTCGGHGRCVSVNMTTTCSCDRGFIAVNQASSLNCVASATPIDESFYDRTLPEPAHPGRDVEPPPSKQNRGCACASTDNVPVGAAAAVMLGALLRMRRRR